MCNKIYKNKIQRNFQCDKCFQNLSRKDSLIRHKKVCKSKVLVNKLTELNFQCDKCYINLSRKDSLIRHKKVCKSKVRFNKLTELFSSEELYNSRNELFKFYEWY